MSEIISVSDTNSSYNSTFATLSDSSCSMITELEQKLQEDTGENVVLVAYRC